MSADYRSLADLQDITEAYAAGIEMNAEMDGRSLHTESMAATVAALTCLCKGFTRDGKLEEFFGLVCALAAIVSSTAKPMDDAQRGGMVSAMLRDMEGF